MTSPTGYIYLLGVDEDEVSILADIGAQAGSAVVAKGIVKALGVATKSASLSNGGALFVLETIISMVGSEAVDYFQRNDIVGHHMISLSRQAGKPVGVPILLLLMGVCASVSMLIGHQPGILLHLW